ncbi:bromodomain adjacent to zinc finger domain protein 1A [Haplochromis burtoni]|uniref:bromodomain adjacent to zinc finger domain protein 1A n=1 Tax=Haplochromis burtoni TaxID=8153 RepID=UPI001C2D0D1E|nr:bromodomain adjacent to zinc finger domain protein 1A [Haplochromis burtoni]
MPLLHRKPFIRQKPPADLRPEEEVFLCKITHEIFRTYDEFFERTILCNSLVWSCALTGRAGLTYLEAVESERRARQSLESFPQSLVVPLLHLAALSQCCRLTELCEDVYTFVKDRFFPGEVVDISGCNGARYVCEILQVHLPDSSVSRAPDVNGHGKMADDDTIVISDSDDEHSAFQSSTVQVNGRKKSLSPSVFKYTVRMMKNKHSEPFTVKANQISRKKSALSRERLKLLFKQHCEPQNGIVTLKPSSMAKYQLSKQTFSQFFPDEPPLFSFSPSSKCGRRDSPGQASSSLLKAAEEKLKLLQQREEMVAAAQDKARLKKEKEEVQEAKRREREDKERLREEQRRRFEEEKQRRREEKERRKLEKDREREKLKEEKKKYAEQLKLWSKPREDMECEDLKELPRPIPVKTRLPAELFGDALMVLEFLQAFGEAFDLKDEFPDGVSLEVLEEALVGSDPEGPLCELLFFFLTAIFQALDEEQEEVAADQVEDLTDALDDDSDPTCSALSAIASLAAAWPQLHQGCSLKQLDLDSCTLSEILRLHILASGADCNHGNAKFRYQKQGGFTVMDDPCVELRLADPALLKKLSSTAVYDLTPGEKLRILQALVGKVLTLASSRDLIEDCVEEQRAARHELREIRAEQHRREREEAAHRVRLRKEEKMREQEQRMRAKEEKMKEQELKGRLQTNGDSCTEHHTGNEEEQSSKIMKAKGNQKEQQQQTASDLKRPTSLTAEELEREQEKVRELQECIQKAAACTCLLPLGRDRLYRRYWLFPSASALFVEADHFGLTEDMLQPSPKPDQDTSTTKVEKGEEMAKDKAASTGPPINQSNQWSFYSSLEEVDHLIEALNPRGHRESSLKEALLQERERLQHLLKSCDRNKYKHTEDQESSQALPECTAAAESMMEVRLRELLLDIEDRIHQGTLGTLKVMDRQVWRLALEAGNYELLASDGRENTGMNGRVETMEVDSAHLRARDRLQEVKSDSSAAYGSSGSGTPQVVSNSVRILAQALTNIEQGIERRFLKAPLADEDSKKDHKMKNKKKKDEDQASDDGSDCGRVSKTVLERWRESLQSCSSLSQVRLLHTPSQLCSLRLFYLNENLFMVMQVLLPPQICLLSCSHVCMTEWNLQNQPYIQKSKLEHDRFNLLCTSRVRLRKEEKMREQEQRMRAKEEKMKEQELKGRLQTNGDSCTEHHTGNEEEQSSKIMKAKGNQKEQQQQTASDLKRPTSLTAEELEREQEKVRELQECIQKAAACTCLLPLGRDRLYRRYWLFPSASALFVEADHFGLTEDMLQPSPKPDQDTSTTKVEKGEEMAKDKAASTGPPINQSNQWSFYSSLEEVDHLIEALNPRGHRESSLKEALLQERERLQHLLKSCDRNKYKHTEDQESSQALPECTAAAESMMEVRLRELLLDIEDRIHQGTLGTLKVMDRQVWRLALEAGNYELLASDGRENTGMNGRVETMEVDSAHLRARDRLQEVKSDSSAAYGSSGSGTPQVVSNSVRILAQALTNIEQGIERRFLKAPLADEDSKKDHKMKNKKKKDEDQASDDGSDCGRVSKTVLERWRESLQSCSSLSQVFVHLSSLERSILWSRSILNARCRICRCKGDADNMVLCDSCDRGHHTHCLRPRMKSVPEGEWFCPDCRPKQRSNRLPSRQRSSIDEEEERDYDDEEEEEEESEEEEEEESEEESEEEEEEEVVVNPKKRQTPLPKGKSQQATPKNSITTSGKNTSASKSSGKKPITPPASDGKIPTRSRSRTGAHVSHENVEPNSHISKRSTKTSPAQSESRKRSLTETAAPRKLSRPILPVLPSSHSPGASSSSSNRRSSGRNQGVHELSACEQLTVELVRHEDSWPFMKLVSRTQVPDYYDIIKKPIALNTIREKVNNCEYQTAGEYISDVELMFSNCLQYNPRHTNEAKAGHRLQRFFHAELSRLGLLEHGSALPTKRSRH